MIYMRENHLHRIWIKQSNQKVGEMIMKTFNFWNACDLSLYPFLDLFFLTKFGEVKCFWIMAHISTKSVEKRPCAPNFHIFPPNFVKTTIFYPLKWTFLFLKRGCPPQRVEYICVCVYIHPRKINADTLVLSPSCQSTQHKDH